DEPVESERSDAAIPAEPDPRLSLRKTASTGQLVAGETITYTFAITNTGNVTLRDVTVAEGSFTGAGELSEIRCPAEADALVPGRTVRCTADYFVQQADVDRGSIENTA
ncbi:DUF7507 domain-containing protein, partial [Agromyces mediolanus]|nr:DUF11 domain-containing protein [Agromyces mediolanus]